MKDPSRKVDRIKLFGEVNHLNNEEMRDPSLEEDDGSESDVNDSTNFYHSSQEENETGDNNEYWEEWDEERSASVHENTMVSIGIADDDINLDGNWSEEKVDEVDEADYRLRCYVNFVCQEKLSNESIDRLDNLMTVLYGSSPIFTKKDVLRLIGHVEKSLIRKTHYYCNRCGCKKKEKREKCVKCPNFTLSNECFDEEGSYCGGLGSGLTTITQKYQHHYAGEGIPAPRAVSADVSRRSRTSCVSLSTDSINRLHRTSNLFQLHPETAMTAEQKQKSLSIESLTKVPEKEKGNRFVRKVATSFRLRKNLLDTDGEEKKSKEENKKKSSVTTSPEQISSFLEKMATRSLPQSPRTDRKAKLYSSLNSTTEKVSNVLSWLPSKSSKRLMKNKSATHDVSFYFNSNFQFHKAVFSGLCQSENGTSLISYTPASTSTQGVIASNENLELLCSTSTSGIPVYLEKCIEFIENNGGFEQEGLYRVPGNQTHLADVEKRSHVARRSAYIRRRELLVVDSHHVNTSSRCGEEGEFDVSSFDTPVHVAATALKSFFSCLPESLIPTDYHSRWKQVMMAADDKERIDGIREALSHLPHSNQTVLRYLVKHLAKVSCSPKTVMNSNNLSKVWTPTLFRPVWYEELSSGIIAFQLALELLIINSDSLFSLNTLL
ncbi:hypothetical protein GCK72_013136 [Caenorhabditis remanei]|uniref:Rho-GAP domain-containing protein n=1 Tax=Caenorhabditis remanei TaxID=31234 RepID=A0A6A5GQM0_CAERE|nr:hypothetical protein GCK72_013136 [Caenorhabditis remanei]KAF1756682.1 hypothetical protein GCK72_013136 [Caenorhabditis remanei]